jgi:hypothetical protein
MKNKKINILSTSLGYYSVITVNKQGGLTVETLFTIFSTGEVIAKGDFQLSIEKLDYIPVRPGQGGATIQ